MSDPGTRSPSAVRFVVAAERLFATHGIDGVSLRQIAAEAGSSNNSAEHDVHRLLTHLDEPIRQFRINEGQSLWLHAAADRERAVASGADVMPFELFANALFDGIAAFLAAPSSDATLRWLRGAGDGEDRRLRLL